MCHRTYWTLAISIRCENYTIKPEERISAARRSFRKSCPVREILWHVTMTSDSKYFYFSSSIKRGVMNIFLRVPCVHQDNYIGIIELSVANNHFENRVEFLLVLFTWCLQHFPNEPYSEMLLGHLFTAFSTSKSLYTVATDRLHMTFDYSVTDYSEV